MNSPLAVKKRLDKDAPLAKAVEKFHGQMCGIGGAAVVDTYEQLFTGNKTGEKKLRSAIQWNFESRQVAHGSDQISDGSLQMVHRKLWSLGFDKLHM